jgi:hypothetical protein
MASAKGGGTTRRASSSRSSQKKHGPEVSPARWAGVALVIAAIVGAVFLAMISPSQPGSESSQQPGAAAEAEVGAEAGASPSPIAATVDVPVPAVTPVITNPGNGTLTPEIEIAVTVDVPEDVAVPRKHLQLHIYAGSDITTLEKPKAGTTVKVQGVRLLPGENTLTAALGSPAGPGPVSDPVVVTLDEDAPRLTITSPENKYQTYDDGVTVEFSSEVGARVRIRNEANKFDQPEQTVNSGGEGSIFVPLKRGVKNQIVATSVDQAGQLQEASVNVWRIDGRPSIKLKFPESVDPPEEIRIVAEVKDDKGKPMVDAEVHFNLGGPNRTTLSESRQTNDKGRAAWVVEVVGSSSPADSLELGVVVISPTTGDKKSVVRNIALK